MNIDDSDDTPFSKSLLSISVRLLVEYVLKSGDLNLEYGDPARPLEGIAMHQKVQSIRPEEYQPEVPVSYRVDTRHVVLEIKGRVDGVYRFPDRVVVEEIKSTRRKLSEVTGSILHWAQVKIYAFIYAKTLDIGEIDARLTYCRSGTDETREFTHHFLLVELETFFLDIVGRYLDWADTVRQWQITRDTGLKVLEFPYPSYRPGQRRMAVDVWLSAKNGDRLIMQAPTGIGKTLGVLFPSLKALGEGYGEKLFYLTARTTGKTAPNEAVTLMRKNGLRIKSLTLTAKDRICFNPNNACNAVECEFAKGYYDREEEGLTAIFPTDDFSWKKRDGIFFSWMRPIISWTGPRRCLPPGCSKWHFRASVIWCNRFFPKWWRYFRISTIIS